MGKVTDGILSGTSGRTGRIVVANVNGYEISRIRPKKSFKKPTPKQLLIQDRFNKAILFISSYREYVKKFYGHRMGLRSTFNEAMSNLLSALHCDMDTLEIVPNYQIIQFSKGKALGPEPLTITSPSPLAIEITWEDNSQASDDDSDKLVVLLAEDEQLSQPTLFYQTNATRVNGSYMVSLLPRYQGKEMHVYIAFVKADQSMASNSFYIGKVAVT